ncbi:cytochrome c oxidase subunit I [Candidatus Spongiisocius sp.]|uniref:cytochrome c oxidase subunit I n=1 Tax=Candidatus Spongiisocius sp. TaxID=3101273 RepID=UPI003B5AA20A
MAIDVASDTVERAETTLFRRPRLTYGFWSWITTADHKKIGLMYGYTAFIFFLAGGIEALLLRIQLAGPDGAFLTAAEYNGLFTTHAVTMIFLFVMPISAAFFNYLLPLMIGARDVAFPRMNAVSFWIFLFGGLFIYSSLIFGTSPPPVGGSLPGGATDASILGSIPNSGWFIYAPNSGATYSPGTAVDYAALGLQILGVASLISAVNFIVTILNMRATGMRLLRMPVFVWMTLVVALLLLFSLPIIAIALFMLTFDRQFGTLFFVAEAGGDPILWQHLFWLFGHPEVYILILPAMGIVSETLPVFSKKPLFGYPAVVFAGAAIAFLGFGVWAHHMFSSGIPTVAQAAFGLSTMTIAIPTGIKIFNWLGTVWGGRVRLTTPMLFSLGFVALFVIGGLSGVTHAVVPSDWQQTDTYYIVAHFHYVLFGGALFGLFAGIYYWFPKVWGRMYNEALGKWHFWLMFIGMNLTFGPMHWLGLQGMVRRTWVYPEEAGLGAGNFVVTVGAFVIAVGVLVFMINWSYSKRRGRVAPNDPWDARTLEWTIPSPTPEYNFAVEPTVTSLDDFWHLKYDEDEEGRAVRKEKADELVDDLIHSNGNPDHEIHLPAPSYFPFIVGFGIMLIAYGIMYHTRPYGIPLLAAGAFLTVGALVAWGSEPLEEVHDEDHGDHGGDLDGEDEDAEPALSEGDV